MIPRTFVLTLALAGALAATTAAAEDRPVGHWWGAVEGSYASVKESFTGGSTRENQFAMNFRGGIIAAPKLLVGAELGGFLLESGDVNDPTKGRGVSQIFAVAQYYLGERRAGTYIKGGAGYASFWGNRPSDNDRSGWGASIAIGYDFVTRDSGAFGPVLTYTQGRMGSADYNAVSLGLSWAYQ